MKFDRKIVAVLLGIGVGIVGFLNVVSSVFLFDIHRLILIKHLFSSEIAYTSRAFTLVAGFFLMYLAWNLARRIQMAWSLAVWLLMISSLAHVIKGLDFEETFVNLFLLVVLWLCREDFTVKSDPDTIKNIWLSLPYTLLFFFSYSVFGFYVLRNHIKPEFDVNLALQDTINLATFHGEKIFTPLNWQARWFFESITLVSGIGVVLVFSSIMKPILSAGVKTRRDEAAAHAIIKAYGTSGISYFAGTPDKSYFFNDESTCIISYVLRKNVALAAGDPVGPYSDIEETVKAFKRFCNDNNWTPAFYQTGEKTIDIYRKAGFKALKIGEEAIIDLPGFVLEGKEHAKLRTIINKGEREGWKVRFFKEEITDESLLSGIKALSQAWQSRKIGGEMGFTMGGTSIIGDSDTLVAILTSSEDKIYALMTWAPIYAAGGWSLDYMERSEDAPNGVNDFLIVKTALYLKENNYKKISLGLAPLANFQTDSSDEIWFLEKGMEMIYENFNTVYKFKTLHAFKKKFDPVWENCYLIFPGAASFPQVCLALISAQMPNLSLREIARMIPKQAAKKGG